MQHADEMFAVLSDPAIYEYENQPPASVEWLRARFEKLESRRSADGTEQWLNWVVRRADAGLIGYVQATVRAEGTAAIAYELSSALLGARACPPRSRGDARRAGRALRSDGVRCRGKAAEFPLAPPAGTTRLHARRSRPASPERDRARRGSAGPRRRAAMSPPGRPKGEYRSAQREGTPVSPPGRPKGEYRSAQREGTPVSPPGRPKGEYRSAQREGTPVSPPGRPKGEYRSAQREGTPVSPPGRPKGEYRSAQREGTPVSPPGRPKGEYRSAQREGTPASAPRGRLGRARWRCRFIATPASHPSSPAEDMGTLARSGAAARASPLAGRSAGCPSHRHEP